jgi:transcriptional regulator with XRE-family HTH domain
MSLSDIAARFRKHSDEKADKQAAAPRNFEEMYMLRARILGVLIRDAREAAGLTQDQCAQSVGVAVDTLSGWEFGKSAPSLPQLELLAYVLDVPISHFWGSETLLQQAKARAIDHSEYVALRGHLIGALLRTARERKNMTPEQLADEAGIPVSSITTYELGQKPIPLSVLVTLAHSCSVNLSYFLEEGSRVGEFLTLQEDLKRLAELPEEIRHFVASPVNQSYIELAMRLSQLSTPELRGIAEAILSITL